MQFQSVDPKTGLVTVNNRLIKDPKDDLWLLNGGVERALNKNPSHHSTSDWDFGNANWELDTAIYVSSPSSLHGTATLCPLLCRIASTLCLPEGMLITQARHNTTIGYPTIYFRNQEPLGGATNTNTYYIDFGTAVKLYRVIGAPTLIGSFPYALPLNTWAKVKVTWWNGRNLQNDLCLAARLHVWEGAQWVKKGDDLYDTVNQWKDSLVNRAGFSATNGGWVDDTEIWGP